MDDAFKVEPDIEQERVDVKFESAVGFMFDQQSLNTLLEQSAGCASLVK